MDKISWPLIIWPLTLTRVKEPFHTFRLSFESAEYLKYIQIKLFTLLNLVNLAA